MKFKQENNISRLMERLRIAYGLDDRPGVKGLLAAKLEVPRNHISQWVKRGRVPIEYISKMLERDGIDNSILLQPLRVKNSELSLLAMQNAPELTKVIRAMNEGIEEGDLTLIIKSLEYAIDKLKQRLNEAVGE